MKNMNQQIRSIFDTEPTSAELTSSRQSFAKRPFHQWNTQFLNPILWKRMALETRTHNETHPRFRRTASQESGYNLPEPGGMPEPQGGTAETNDLLPPSLSPPCEKITHFSAQAPPAYTRKVTPTTSAINIRVVSSTHHVPKNSEQYHVRALATRTSHLKGRLGMATCTLCRLPNTWIDNKRLIIFGGQKLLGMVKV